MIDASRRAGTMSRRACALLAACLWAGLAAATPDAASPLGNAVSALERRLGGDPAAASAGAEATAQYAAGTVSAALAVFEQSRHLDRPRFARAEGIDGRPGLSNPDNIYLTALVDERGVYRIRGRRGSHAMLTLQVLDAYPIVGLGQNLAVLDLDAEGVRPGDEFEVGVGAQRQPGLWLALPPGARALLVRQSFEDWTGESPSVLQIARLDAGAASVEPDQADATAAAYVTAADRLWNQEYLPRIGQLPVNVLPPPRASDVAAGGLGGQQSVMARYRLAPDEALLVTVRKSAARYQGIQLGNPWFVTPDWIARQVSLTRAQSSVDPDGMLRFVVSLRDPGVANWLDPAGFAEGYLFVRWQGLPRPLGAEDAPTARLVKLDALGDLLPAGTRRLAPAERARQIAARTSAPARK